MGKKKSVNMPPDAATMINSYRSSGYSLSTAIADLIDNSITAKAKNIWLNLNYRGKDSFITITDDGLGMSQSELQDSLKWGSCDPRIERDKNDLGRFGMGLKTASFSQGTRLTVISKKKGKSKAVARWDLDYLEKNPGWNLLTDMHADTPGEIDEISSRSLKTGTVVVIEKLDRLINPSITESQLEKSFARDVDLVRQHLEMVFHRFLEKDITIEINDSGEKLEAWDPFYKDDAKTIKKERERVSKGVFVKGYVLPHAKYFDKDEESKEKHKKLAGPKGWCDQQGFYLYRNKRMLISGGWLGIGGNRGTGWTKDEHMKLARISLDIPNSLDDEWKIDIKKSSAEPPFSIRKELENYAAQIRNEALNVYNNRAGKKLPRKKTRRKPKRIWKINKRDTGKFSYKIDNEHPLIKSSLKSLSKEQQNKFKNVLSFIEETVPIEAIWIETSTQGEVYIADSFEDYQVTKIRTLIDSVFESFIHAGKTEKEAWEEVRDFPPFQSDKILGIIQSME